MRKISALVSLVLIGCTTTSANHHHPPRACLAYGTFTGHLERVVQEGQQSRIEEAYYHAVCWTEIQEYDHLRRRLARINEHIEEACRQSEVACRAACEGAEWSGRWTFVACHPSQ